MAKVKQAELAYEALKRAIVTLAIRPGEFLNMSQLMQRYQLGRTPINQALHRLNLEKLVTIIPRKGVIVTPICIEEALAVIEVRTVNEALCARLAAKHITDDQLISLKNAQCNYGLALDGKDALGLLEADRHFHEVLALASGNCVLPEILTGLHARAQRFWAISLDIEHHGKEVEREHDAIIAALESRDEHAAVEAIESHIRSFRDNFMKTVPKTFGFMGTQQ